MVSVGLIAKGEQVLALQKKEKTVLSFFKDEAVDDVVAFVEAVEVVATDYTLYHENVQRDISDHSGSCIFFHNVRLCICMVFANYHHNAHVSYGISDHLGFCKPCYILQPCIGADGLPVKASWCLRKTGKDSSG